MAKNKKAEKRIDARTFGTGQYYKSDRYAIEVSFMETIISKSTQPKKSEDILFVFVRNGEGSIQVNGLRYALHPGDGFMLSFSDYYAYSLKKGKSLELLVCSTNIWTYLLVINCPRYQASIADISTPFSLLHFDSAEASQVLMLWKRANALAGLPDALGESSRFYSLMEIVGTFFRKRNTPQQL